MLDILVSLKERLLGSDIIFRRIISNSGWLFSANTISMGLALVQGIIIARLLGVEQYGILTLIITFTATVNQFVDSRVWETAIKFVTQFREQADPAKATAVIKLCYLIDAVTAGLAFVVIFLTAGLAAHLFVKDDSTAGLIQLYAFSLIIAIPFGTSSALLRISDRFDWLAYQGVGEAAIRLIGAIIVAAIGGGLLGILLAYLVARMAGVLALVILGHRGTKQVLQLTSWGDAPLHLLKGNYRRILKFVLFSNLGATSRLITSRADLLFLGWFAVPSEVGLYKLGKTLAAPLGMLFNPVYMSVYPELSKLVGQANFHQIKALVRRLSRTIVVMIIPLCLFATFFMAWFIPIAFGVEYQDSVILTQIMVWNVVWTPLIWLPGLLLSTERTRLFAGLNWLDALSYLILLVLFVPVLGALGAAIATLLRFVLWTLAALGIVNYVDRRFDLSQRKYDSESITSEIKSVV